MGRQPSSYPWKPETRSCRASHSCTAPSATQTGSPTPAPRNGRPRRRTSQGPETTQLLSVDPLEGVIGPGAARSQSQEQLRPPGLGSKLSGLEQKRPSYEFSPGTSLEIRRLQPLSWPETVRAPGCLVPFSSDRIIPAAVKAWSTDQQWHHQRTCWKCRLSGPTPDQLIQTRHLVRSPGDSATYPGGSDGKESACNAGDLGSIPGSGRSPGEGNGSPLQYCCLENPVDRGAWRATVHGVTESDPTERLSSART